MSQKGRLDSIRTMVKTEKRVVVSELSQQFEGTEETIRRDLEKLEKRDWQHVPAVERAQKVYLLVDHTKFGKVAFTRLFGIDQIDVVITDREPPAEWLEWFAANNVQLIF